MVVWAQVVTHAPTAVLYATPRMPTYIPPVPSRPVYVCGRFIRDGKMLYLTYELPSVLDGGHILKAGCQAHLLGRPWPERAGQAVSLGVHVRQATHAPAE